MTVTLNFVHDTPAVWSNGAGTTERLARLDRRSMREAIGLPVLLGKEGG
jgi:hypothetical protein